MEVKIYGSSDDCIEVDGNLREEFYLKEPASYLHFGDGTVVKAEYAPKDDDDYRWRFTVMVYGGCQVEKAEGTYHEEEPGAKCDKLILKGDLKNVRCWSSVGGPTKRDIQDWIDNFDIDDVTPEQALRIMEILQ